MLSLGSPLMRCLWFSPKSHSWQLTRGIRCVLTCAIRFWRGTGFASGPKLIQGVGSFFSTTVTLRAPAAARR
jgi:hypothetical protein